MTVAELRFSFILLIGLMLYELLTQGRQEKFEKAFFNSASLLRWVVYVLLVLAVLYLGVYGANDNAFIYFQF